MAGFGFRPQYTTAPAAPVQQRAVNLNALPQVQSAANQPTPGTAGNMAAMPRLGMTFDGPPNPQYHAPPAAAMNPGLLHRAPDPNSDTPAVPTTAQPLPYHDTSLQPPPPQQQLGYYNQPQQFQFYQPPQQQFQPQQSITQQAGGSHNTQSVQNYLTALKQVGAGGNNTMMNGAGQLGAGAQAGFQGFGQNGSYGPQFVNPGYMGGMQSQLGYQQNGAYAGPNYNVGNYSYQGRTGQMAGPQAYGGGIQQGGTGGVNGTPQWTTPQPWGQPLNNYPGDPGSGYQNTSQGKEDYDYGRNTPGERQGGQFYSDLGTTDAQGKPTQGVVSDINAKTNISNAQSELEDFMNALGVYSYEYKNKDHGEGRYISPMAQEFEKSKLGATAVETDETGLKKVNYGRLMGVQTAALGLLNHKYNDLEKKFNKLVNEKLNKRSSRGK